MKKRTLGRTDLEVPVVVFGAWAIGGWQWGGTDDRQAVAAIQEGIDCGITAIDTAPIYGFGHSEELVARAIRGRRDEVLVMTKAGLRWEDCGPRFEFAEAERDGKPIKIWRNASAASVRHEVEESLRRLQVERIDLLQIHWPDKKTSAEETMTALAELRTEGKIREIGVSNYSSQELAEAQAELGAVPLASNQPKYNLVTRDIEEDSLPWARGNEVGVMVYSPIEQGLLTGKVSPEREFPDNDIRSKRPTFRPENRKRVNDTLREVVQPIADTHSATLAQTVIAWTVSQPGITAAIVGARKPEQARENARAGALELTEAELATIDRAFRDVQMTHE